MFSHPTLTRGIFTSAQLSPQWSRSLRSIGGILFLIQHAQQQTVCSDTAACYSLTLTLFLYALHAHPMKAVIASTHQTPIEPSYVMEPPLTMNPQIRC